MRKYEGSFLAFRTYALPRAQAYASHRHRRLKLVYLLCAGVWMCRSGWKPGIAEALVGTVLVGLPLVGGVLHRRIRLEAAKGPDALYRKRIEASRN